MALETGQTLSFYEVLGPLGAGGMGEVYRARDTRLDREVALKVLPEDFAASEDRLQRFDREAKTLAALSHPNIAGIHGVDQVDDVCFLALELVEGEDLATRLARGPLAIDEAIDVCRQIAEGLEAAHEAGVVHRDLKPANVRVTPDGVVKVLDFGLAKPMGARAASGASVTPQSDSFALTADGMVLGTPMYMSPEQVKGRPVDRRTDVWAFGCVLFECLTGKRAFHAESGAEIMAAILAQEPDWSLLPKGLPPNLRLLLERTLTRDPRQRLRDLGDARIELESTRELAAAVEPGEPTARRSLASPAVLGLAAVAIVAAFAAGRLTGGGEVAADAPADRFAFRQLTYGEGLMSYPSLSPDGKFVVYGAQLGDESEVLLQRVGGASVQNLTAGIDADCFTPAMSPDGMRIAFRSEQEGGGLFVMGATGESPRRVTDFGFNPAWSPDGTQLAFASRPTFNPLSRQALSSLHVVDVTGGSPRQLPVPDAMQPSWSPNGRWIAYWGYEAGGRRDLFATAVEGGRIVRLTEDAPTDWNPVWSADGTSLYYISDRGGVMDLWRMPMDPESATPTGAPVQVTSGVGAGLAYVGFSADDSTVAFASVTALTDVYRIAFDLERRTLGGPRERVPGTRYCSPPVFSPDGEWMTVTRMARQEDLFVARADGTDWRQITQDEFKDRSPVWNHDGSRVYFFSDRSGLYQVWSCTPDGGDLTQHTGPPGQMMLPFLSPDGSRMVCSDIDGRLYLADPRKTAAEQTPVALPQPGGSEARQLGYTWSHDGKYVATYTVRDGLMSLDLLDVDAGEYALSVPHAATHAWLPDSNDFLYITQDGPSIFLWDFETGTSSLVYEAADGEGGGSISLSPDGAWAYVALAEYSSDVWIGERVTD
jgi:Tol biopolymer transport system component